MEGRISREELAAERRPVQESEASPQAESADMGRASYAPRRSSYRSSYYSSGRRGYRSARRTRPAGWSAGEESGSVLAQLFASGILLLFVLFVALVDSSSTLAIRQKLQAAFARNTTVAEMAQSTAALKDRLLGQENLIDTLVGGETGAKKAPETPAGTVDIDSLLLEQLQAEQEAKNE